MCTSCPTLLQAIFISLSFCLSPLSLNPLSSHTHTWLQPGNKTILFLSNCFNLFSCHLSTQKTLYLEYIQSFRCRFQRAKSLLSFDEEEPRENASVLRSCHRTAQPPRWQEWNQLGLLETISGKRVLALRQCQQCYCLTWEVLPSGSIFLPKAGTPETFHS